MHQYAPALLIINGKSSGNEEVRAAVNQLRNEGQTCMSASPGNWGMPLVTSKRLAN
ncbi:lipid kinase YegS [Serratia fonticola]|uniref:Lipid kinase YegS n=1 Tax=Serratia fonticola TaxID=47917 RepID=A0A4U9WJ60_SERFO|nr:lipid kinase YegS [Serratia fonticola]